MDNFSEYNGNPTHDMWVDYSYSDGTTLSGDHYSSEEHLDEPDENIHMGEEDYTQQHKVRRIPAHQHCNRSSSPSTNRYRRNVRKINLGELEHTLSAMERLKRGNSIVIRLCIAAIIISFTIFWAIY